MTWDPLMQWDTLILGGGVAGLSAAVQLLRSGRRPLLLEAAPNLGGRARSFHDHRLQQQLDNGPHLCVGAYHHFLSLLEQIGSRHQLTAVDLPFWSEPTGWYQLSCPDGPPPWQLLAALWRCSVVQWHHGPALLRLGRALRADSVPDDQQSVTHWLQQLGQPADLCQYLWGPLCQAALNEPPASASAALLATVLRRTFLGQRGDAQILMARVPLNDLIARPARRYIEAHGGHLMTRTRVTALEQRSGRISAVITSQGQIDTSQGVPVIAALPLSALRRLLPQWSESTGLHQLSFSPIVTVHTQYQRSAQLSTPLAGLPLNPSQWLFDRQTDPAGGARITAVISAAYRESSWSAQRLLSTVHQDITRLLPQLAQETPVFRIVREQRATLAAWPGSSHWRPVSTTPWHNLLLAGDWTSTGVPATLEGAAMSGVVAARAVVS
ncbi:MAG: FAD-dependent oxidoreductase [Magnetococcales bacterium]|nr:FAD-dependent oxidoreductase [Magnetococcales bacterium]